MSAVKKRIPVRQGLFTIPSSPNDKAQLLASECPSCGEIVFPRSEICPNCQGKNLREIRLSRRAKIYSFTILMQKPAAHYKGPVPYAFGWVELPEGVRVESLFTGCDLEELKIGMDVELTIEKLHNDNEGNEIICHKFKPVRIKERLF